MEKIFSKN